MCRASIRLCQEEMEITIEKFHNAPRRLAWRTFILKSRVDQHLRLYKTSIYEGYPFVPKVELIRKEYDVIASFDGSLTPTDIKRKYSQANIAVHFDKKSRSRFRIGSNSYPKVNRILKSLRSLAVERKEELETVLV